MVFKLNLLLILILRFKIFELLSLPIVFEFIFQFFDGISLCFLIAWVLYGQDDV